MNTLNQIRIGDTVGFKVGPKFYTGLVIQVVHGWIAIEMVQGFVETVAESEVLPPY